MIKKVSEDPQVILDEREISSVVQASMLHGESDLLSLLLAQQPLDELTVSQNGEKSLSYALNTLLEALPPGWSVRRLILSGHVFNSSDCELLFHALNRIGSSSLRLRECTVIVDLHTGLPDFPFLQKLEDLEITGDAFSLLEKILGASRLGALSLRSEGRLVAKQHADIADTLRSQGTLRALSLHFAHAESLDPVIRSYALFLKSQTTVEHVDLSETPLSSDACVNLWDALQDKQLPRLSMSGCWSILSRQTMPEEASKLCSLQKLVRIDFSGNSIRGDHAESVLAALTKHPTLQYLDLDGTYLPDEVADTFFSYLAGNTTLVSLRLPYMPDEKFARLAKAIEGNRSLRYVSAPYIEKRRGMEGFVQEYGSYLALVEYASINKRRSDVELVATGIQQVLHGLGQGRQDVPLDVARYAANIALATDDMDRGMVMGWTTLTRHAAEEASKARARQAEARKK